MRLMLTGVIPLWVLLTIFAAMSGLVVFIYRKQSLSPPWSYILPLLRITVIALLILALLQPVASFTRTEEVRGQIPILVDTSGSMSLIDSYPIDRQITICWQMKLFPRKLRSVGFAELGDKWAALGDDMQKAESLGRRLQRHINEQQPWTREFKRDVATFADMLSSLRKKLNKICGSLSDTTNNVEYLGMARHRGPRGAIEWLRYDNIVGDRTTSLVNQEKYPAKPDRRMTLESFQIPPSTNDNYGGIVSGYLVPDQTGDYQFIIRANDEGILFLSDNADPASKKRVVASLRNTARSSSVKLKKGKTYYIQAVFKELNGDDHLSVGWRLPDGKIEQPIPGKYLHPSLGYAEKYAFRLQHDRFSSMANELADTMDQLSKAITAINKAKVKTPLTLTASLKSFTKQINIYRNSAGLLADIQSKADICLAAADISDVDSALATLSRMSRSDIAQYVLSKDPFNLVDRLRRRGDVSVFSFDEQTEPIQADSYSNLVGSLSATRIGSIMYAVLKQYEKRPVSAVLVLSDGNNNAGKAPHAALQIARERSIPVIALGIGAREPPHDIAIARVASPRTVFVGDHLNVNVVVARHGYTDRRITLTVMKGDKIMKERIMEPGDNAKAVIDLSFIEEESGMHEYTIKAETFDDEALMHNNSKSFAVRVLEDRIKTLLIDEFPRWESRYAHMTLKRDKRIDLHTIFIGSTEDGEIPMASTNSPAARNCYPENRNELFGYHVLIIGDVDPTHFTRQQLQDIYDFVVERGGTLITMAGEHHMPSDYSGTPLADLIPLKRFGSTRPPISPPRPPRGQTPGPAMSGPFRLELSIAGRYEDVVQIGITPEASADLWEGLPNLCWVRGDTSLSPSATLLANVRHSRGSATKSVVPVIAAAYVGLGKTLYIGSDEFWRWRYRARWTYHHRFWGQILLWSTMGRTTGSDANVKMMVDRLAYAPDETVLIRARILDDSGVPLNNANASIDVFNRDNERVKTLPLMPLENSGGEYRTELTDLPRGKYRVVPRVPQFSDKTIEAEVSFEVRDLPTSEYVDLALNNTVLSTIADVYMPFELALDVVDKVPELKFTEEHRSDKELWDTFFFMILVSAILGIEWSMRKKHKLV